MIKAEMKELTTKGLKANLEYEESKVSDAFGMIEQSCTVIEMIKEVLKERGDYSVI